jgi:hypothetical protein
MHYYSYLFVFRYTTTINYTTFVRTFSVPDGVKHIKPPWLGQLYSEILGWICVPSQNFHWYSATNFLWRAKAATEITRQAPIPSQCPVKLPSLQRLMDLMNPIARLPARGTDSLRHRSFQGWKITGEPLWNSLLQILKAKNSPVSSGSAGRGESSLLNSTNMNLLICFEQKI